MGYSNARSQCVGAPIKENWSVYMCFHCQSRVLPCRLLAEALVVTDMSPQLVVVLSEESILSLQDGFPSADPVLVTRGDGGVLAVPSTLDAEGFS